MLYFRGNRLGISTHAPRTGSDGFYLVRRLLRVHEFQPTLPARGATIGAGLWGQTPEDFNPRSPHGERPSARACGGRPRKISTHAPRTGSDLRFKCKRGTHSDFNPRSPHGERHMSVANLNAFALISTHAPRTGSDLTLSRFTISTFLISTHAPRTGSDKRGERCIRITQRFQPTLPARGATRSIEDESGDAVISTHAPRTGSDLTLSRFTISTFLISTHAPRTGSDLANSIGITSHIAYFNPRSPHGERRMQSSATMKPYNFNPRSPHGERRYAKSTNVQAIGFQPTLPARGATVEDCKNAAANAFQPTLPARGATRVLQICLIC